MDALFRIDYRLGLVIDVEVLLVGDIGNCFANDLFPGIEAFFVHPVVEAVDHVLHDAKTLVHGRGIYLHTGRAQQNKLQGVPPGGNASDTGDGKLLHFGVPGDLRKPLTTFMRFEKRDA